MFSASLLGHFQPLTWFTYALDYQLWGLNPRGYHITNIAIHAANAALVYFLFLRVLTGRAPLTPAIRAGAALASAMWALHPLRVESVAWVTERRDVLSLM